MPTKAATDLAEKVIDYSRVEDVAEAIDEFLSNELADAYEVIFVCCVTLASVASAGAMSLRARKWLDRHPPPLEQTANLTPDGD